MEINASKRGPRLHVKLSGELDHHSAEQTRNMLDTLLKDITVRDLTLDLSGVSFMDSAGLGLILGRYARASVLGIPVIIRNPSPRHERLLQMAEFHNIVKIERKEAKRNEKAAK